MISGNMNITQSMVPEAGSLPGCFSLRKRFEQQQKLLEEERKRRQFEEQKQKLRLLSSVKPKVIFSATPPLKRAHTHICAHICTPCTHVRTHTHTLHVHLHTHSVGFVI